MAIWQFDLTFVPRRVPVQLRGPEEHAARLFTAQETARAIAWLSARFGAPWKMLGDWLVFGAEDGNRVDILLNKDGTAEFEVRIDARIEAIEFVAALCDLSALVDGELFSVESWKPLEAKPFAVGFALERSGAAAFIRDPESILKGAGSGL